MTTAECCRTLCAMGTAAACFTGMLRAGLFFMLCTAACFVLRALLSAAARFVPWALLLHVYAESITALYITVCCVLLHVLLCWHFWALPHALCHEHCCSMFMLTALLLFISLYALYCCMFCANNYCFISLYAVYCCMFCFASAVDYLGDCFPSLYTVYCYVLYQMHSCLVYDVCCCMVYAEATAAFAICCCLYICHAYDGVIL